MEFLKNLFKNKDKKLVYNLLLMFCVGIVLLVASATIFKPEKPAAVPTGEPENINGADAAQQTEAVETYEQGLEKRLEQTLSLVEGAGNVRVMVTINYGKEIVVAQNIDATESVNDEKDNEGGTRNVQSKSEKNTFVMLRQKDGSEYPLILKEIEPKVEGVVIVAEGGDNIVVKDALVRAACSVLGAQSHKVEVLKMKAK